MPRSRKFIINASAKTKIAYQARAGLGHAIEAFEHAAAVFFRDSRSFIGHRHLDAPADACDLDENHRPLRRTACP